MSCYQPDLPRCVRAEALLKKKGAAFEEIDISVDPAARQEDDGPVRRRPDECRGFSSAIPMSAAAMISMPLEREGKLDPLLA